MVSPRIRLSAKATSSGRLDRDGWQTISMSRCSSIVLIVYGSWGSLSWAELGSPQMR